ncbi:unnamed protein product [Darwinula stevensoni]|uniref:PLAT domain-containing protein n=1 Tax=Darwinula stevensoni TaxID=69355 RepID=A0A7R8XAL0_9CRUS|nr:unnamed protein product [Darwinula stevensoni]CAG0890374.1 unnamed protein product [Darwinula stevensoni]
MRTFGKPKRPIFRKGAVDAFVMTTSRSLGPLNYMRIWHDNSGIGTRQSWFLNFVIVKDIQTGEKYEFIANRWFAVEEDDGQVDRLLPVAGLEQKKDPNFLFNTHSQRNLYDEHLWFSVFMRPPRSRFTRVQRVSCCMAFLYLSMLTNAMWYGTVPQHPTSNALRFGPFILSTAQIGVGMMANLIIFPPSFLIVFLFRKSRPRKLRPSRIDRALDLDGRPQYISSGGVEQSKKMRRKKRFSLPWWFVVLAWLLVIVCIAVSVFFVWAYGIQFGNEKTCKWATSLVTSFFSSVLIVEPLKILLMALLFSCIFKVEPSDDDADEDEEDPRLRYDQEWIPERRNEGVGYRPMNQTALQAIREKRLQEVRMWEIIKEIALYIFYLWVILILSYGNRNPNAFYLKDAFDNAFLRIGNPDVDFTKVVTTSDYWSWLNGVVMDQLRAQNWYNGDAPWGFKGFLDDRVNRLLGYGTLRQVRVRPQTCLYTDASEMGTLPIVGNLDVYSGGGYVVELKGLESEIRDRLVTLQGLDWIDRYTRAVFLEFFTYNAQVNLFGVCRVMVEMIPGGGMVPSSRFDGITLLPYQTTFGVFILICELLFLLFILYFTYQCFRACCREKRQYFHQYWNYVDMTTLLLGWTAVGLYAYRYVVTRDILEKIFESYGNEYVNLQHVALIDEIFGYMIAFLTFIGMVSFIRLLRFNRRMGVLAATMRQCWNDLLGFGFVFFTFFIAFCLMFNLFFYTDLEEWRNFVTAFETCFSMLLGKFKFDSMRQTNIVGAVFFFFFALSMSLVMINILMTIIIRAFEVIKTDLFKQPNEYEVMEFLWARAKSYFGLSGRRGRVAPTSQDPQNHDKGNGKNQGDDKAWEVNQKVDMLIHHINTVYFHGNLDLSNKDWMKEIPQRRNITGRNRNQFH